jgi:hypothetical protein
MIQSFIRYCTVSMLTTSVRSPNLHRSPVKFQLSTTSTNIEISETGLEQEPGGNPVGKGHIKPLSFCLLACDGRW